ncbi:MAG TPA: DUF302 domain-containing protein [Anaerolineales bacterium]
MSLNIGFCRDIPSPFSDALVRVTQALQKEGFRVLTEIDLTHLLTHALGAGHAPVRLFSVVNPELAQTMLHIDTDLSLLLACSVVVSGNDDGSSRVRIADPIQTLGPVAHPHIKPVADELNRRLTRVYLDVVVFSPA